MPELGFAGVEDVFAAGERVDLSEAITGSAHLAGRRVNGDAEIGGNLYAAGADVTLRAPVAGDATLAGYDINVLAAVGADLRAGGANLHVAAPIGGTALLAGRNVEINAVIAGDMAVAAEDIEFGPDARINGKLRLYGEDLNDLVVPDRVVAPDRIERVDVYERVGSGFTARGPRIAYPVISFVVGVLLIAGASARPVQLRPRRSSAPSHGYQTVCSKRVDPSPFNTARSQTRWRKLPPESPSHRRPHRARCRRWRSSAPRQTT